MPQPKTILSVELTLLPVAVKHTFDGSQSARKKLTWSHTSLHGCSASHIVGIIEIADPRSSSMAHCQSVKLQDRRMPFNHTTELWNGLHFSWSDIVRCFYSKVQLAFQNLKKINQKKKQTSLTNGWYSYLAWPQQKMPYQGINTTSDLQNFSCQL